MNQSRKGKAAKPNPKTKKQSSNGATRKVGALSKKKTVGAPSAYARPVQVYAPRLDKRSGSTWRFSRREFIANINESAAFGVTRFPVNPGMVETFPWLASQAAKWEEYRFHSLKFEYITRTVTTTVGSIIMSPDYDASEEDPTTEAQMSTYEDTVEFPPWMDGECVLPVKSMYATGPRKYIRSSAVSGDKKLYDVASFFVGRVGGSGTAAVGKLWVDYDVELFIPQIEGGFSPSRSCMVSAQATNTFITNVQSAIDWDTLFNNGLGAIITATGDITLPRGRYNVIFSGSFNDDTNESANVRLRFSHNGVVSSVYSSYQEFPALTAGTYVTVPLVFNVNLEAGDTFSVAVLFVGPTGTLTAIAGSCSMMITVA